MKGTVIQLGSAMILALLISMTSFSNVWPSYAMPVLKSDKSPLGYPITEFEGNVISSIPMLGSIISTLLTGYIAEAFGRKRTQILCALIFMVSWSIIATARTTTQILIGRFIIGLSSGTALVSVVVYISEITELSNRGSGSAVASLLFNLGIMTSYLEGWFLSYDAVSYANVTTTVVIVVLMSGLKESPSWLLRSRREEEALSALKFYRGESETTDAILEELTYLKSQVKNHQGNADAEKPMLTTEIYSQNEKTNIDDSENKNPWIQLVAVDYNRRALLIIIMFMVLSVCTGMVAVQTYANQFFAKAVPSFSPDFCSVLLALLLIVASLASVLFNDFISRRTCMISTCLIATVCLATLGAAMRWTWIPVWVAPFVIIIYCLDFQIGVINIVFMQAAESFGPQVNSAAVAIIFCFLFASNFLVIFLFGPAVKYFGIDGTFFIFASIGLVTTILSIFFLKETRRVPLEDVQKMYSKGFLCTRL